MLDRMRQATAGYPRQFGLLFWGMLISAAGGSTIWPFLTIYVRQRQPSGTAFWQWSWRLRWGSACWRERCGRRRRNRLGW
jgi:hypothetical protein